MSDDAPVKRALKMLRDSSDGTHAAAERTRAEVLRGAQRKRERRRVERLVLPLAAALMVSAAWAAESGRLSRWWGEPAARAVSPVAVGRPSGTAAPATAAAPSVASSSPPVVAGPSERLAPAPSSASLPKKAQSRLRSEPAPAAGPASARAGSEPPARERALYDVAHQAHFARHDPAAALRGWEGYLAEFPAGSFALEARYNRAISLVRLGRRAEAHPVLSAFARGAYGGYRQSEAAELLRALDDAGGP
jgi:hypothetical protein